MFKEFFQFVRLADKFFLKMNFEKKSFCRPPEADRIHTKTIAAFLKKEKKGFEGKIFRTTRIGCSQRL